MGINRRKFLGACASACLINGVQLSLSKEAFAAGKKTHTLIYIFLSGGMDGLSFVCPIDGNLRDNYDRYRRVIAVPEVGKKNGALKLGQEKEWGINPHAESIQSLWNNKKLAIIHATGMDAGHSTRSHFESQRLIETGSVFNSTKLFTGWMKRYLDTLNLSSDVIVPAVSAGLSQMISLSGFRDGFAVQDLPSYNAIQYGKREFEHNFLEALKGIYASGDKQLERNVRNALDFLDGPVQNISGIAPPSGLYPTHREGLLFGKKFRTIAQIMRSKEPLGLQAATLDLGNWDTHRNQGTTHGLFANKLKSLCQCISAFTKEMEMSGHGKDYTIIVQSEFGRRVRENANQGCDHGTGNMMMIIGDKVRGGKFYGDAPELTDDTLFESQDIATTTDYRQVISEVLRHGCNVSGENLSGIFPGYDGGKPLNFMKSSIVFSDSFES